MQVFKIQNVPNDPATAISLHQIIFVYEINTLHTYEVLSKMAWVWLATFTTCLMYMTVVGLAT